MSALLIFYLVLSLAGFAAFFSVGNDEPPTLRLATALFVALAWPGLLALLLAVMAIDLITDFRSARRK